MKDCRELTQKSIEWMRDMQRVKTGGNMAAFPTLIICLGQGSASWVHAVKDTLDDNWNNARYLRYLAVEMNGDKASCRGIFRSTSFDDVQEGILQTVVEMMSEDEKVFVERSQVKLEFILNADEEDGYRYYELYEDIKKVMNYVLIKTLYLMVDESTGEKSKRSGDLYDQIRRFRNSDDNKGTGGTVYVLSNCLRGGKFLLGEKKELNYRLVADIILLGGNARGGNWSRENGIYGGMKTAAYSLVTKPVEDIALISLEELCVQIQEMAAQADGNSRKGSGYDFNKLMDRIGVQLTSVRAIDKLFDRFVADKIPSPAALEALPFLSESDYKTLKNRDRMTWEEADRITCQVFSLLYEQSCEKPMKQFLADQEQRQDWTQQIYQEWREKLDLYEIKALFSSEDFDNRLKGMGSGTVSGGKSAGFPRMAYMMKEKCRADFYENMIPILEETAGRLRREAEQVEQIFGDLCQELKSQRLRGADSQVIENFYRNEVREFLQKEAKDDIDQIFTLNLFDGLDVLSDEGEEGVRERILDKVGVIYQRLLEEREVYRASLEEELERRMNQLTPAARMKFVSDMLNENIEKEGRLNCLYNYTNNRTGSYYLIKTSAAYYKELQRNMSTGGYQIFDLNRTDSIEKIEVYGIDVEQGVQLASQMA